jgi:CRISPR/Cas system-associated protein Cas5 (RAMP superfamily)
MLHWHNKTVRTPKISFLLRFINPLLPSLSVGELELEIWGIERLGIL